MRIPTICRTLLWGSLVVVGLRGFPGNAQTARPEVGIEEHLGTTLPLDVQLYDEKGYLTPLRSVITKPTILTFVYFRCPGICSPLLTELSRVVDGLDLELGKDYQVVTISFDHREKPEMAAEKKESYLSAMKHHVNPAGWRWFTGDSVSIHQVTDAAGFYFKRDRDDWIHAGALIVVSPAGKVTRYINGIQFLPFDVKMAVLEAAEGKTAPTIAKLLTFCYSYDPEARTYALNVTRISGVVIVLLALVFVAVFILRPKLKSAER
jgi:protein SCO1/2